MLPTEEQLAHVLSGVLGRAVKTKRAKPGDSAKPDQRFWGVYIDDIDQVRSICVCDLAFAAHAGAALALFPPARAQESLKARQLEPLLQENLTEVLNILARMFNANGKDHLRFRDILIQTGPTAPDLGLGVQPRATSIDFEVAINGYGDGKMSFTWIPQRISTQTAMPASQLHQG